MDKKSSVFLTIIVLVLVIVIGIGGYVLIQKRQIPEVNLDTMEQPKVFSIAEVARHNSKKDCWSIISGNVYDLSSYVIRHPGGDEILRACGVDATTLFTQRQTESGRPVGSGSPHSQVADEQLAKFKIGVVLES